jgi:hypothetical protein
VVAALGLTLKDLFPPRDLPPKQRRAYAAEKGLAANRRVLAHELHCLLQIVTAHINHWPIDDPDPEGRERLAVARIRRALGVLYASR